MTSPEVRENHTLVVRDGRILDVLPSSLAAERYSAGVHVDRAQHLLLPGLVNAYTRIAPPPGRTVAPERLQDGARVCIAEMLEAGTTCFCSVGPYPEEAARAATEQGMRALIGMPIAEAAGPWAASPGEYLTRALSLRDEYRGHPTVSTAFAPLSPADISDTTFLRIATLADELDAGIVAPLNESCVAIDESLRRYGMRPIERLHALGLLSPSFTAAHMTQINAADLALAVRGGIAVILCPESDLRSGRGAPPVAAWAASGLRLAAGSGIIAPAGSPDLWSAMRMLALWPDESCNAVLGVWDALALATRGGAAALGLDAEIGTLEAGKWADVCCVDLGKPAMHWATLDGPPAAAPALVFKGGRDSISDVWVSGRHLRNAGEFSRLDWPRVAARSVSRPADPPVNGASS